MGCVLLEGGQQRRSWTDSGRTCCPLHGMHDPGPCAGEDCLGQCLYVAGVPGTGKTATLHEVMRQMRAQAEAGLAGSFRYVEINALRLASPQHAYVHLYRVSILSPAGAIWQVTVHTRHDSHLQMR